MRRALILLPAALLVLSCTPSSPSAPADVLQRAARASRDLRSARFNVEITYDGGSGALVGKATMDGVMQDGGRQLEFSVLLEGTSVPGERESRMQASVVVPSDEEVDVKIGSIAGDDPLFASPALRAMRGKWLSIATASGGGKTVAPDPQLLRAQAEVVTIERDRGIETLNGRQAHHFDVRIQQDKLETFLRRAAADSGQQFDPAGVRAFFDANDVTGELWIDTETYLIHRLSWTAEPKEDDGAEGSLVVTLTDHNEAPAVNPPSGVRPFSPSTLLEGLTTAGTGSLTGGELPPELERQLLDSMFLDR